MPKKAADLGAERAGSEAADRERVERELRAMRERIRRLKEKVALSSNERKIQDETKR